MCPHSRAAPKSMSTNFVPGDSDVCRKGRSRPPGVMENHGRQVKY